MQTVKHCSLDTGADKNRGTKILRTIMRMKYVLKVLFQVSVLVLSQKALYILDMLECCVRISPFGLFFNCSIFFVSIHFRLSFVFFYLSMCVFTSNLSPLNILLSIELTCKVEIKTNIV